MVPFTPPAGGGKLQRPNSSTTQVCNRPPPCMTAVGVTDSTRPPGSIDARTVSRPCRSACSISARSKQPCTSAACARTTAVTAFESTKPGGGDAGCARSATTGGADSDGGVAGAGRRAGDSGAGTERGESATGAGGADSGRRRRCRRGGAVAAGRLGACHLVVRTTVARPFAFAFGGDIARRRRHHPTGRRRRNLDDRRQSLGGRQRRLPPGRFRLGRLRLGQLLLPQLLERLARHLGGRLDVRRRRDRDVGAA